MSSLEGTVYSAERPGCISAYAIMLWLASGVLVLGLFGSLSDPFVGPEAAVCPGIFAILLIAVGIGLWQMKPWGWWVVVILQSLGVLVALFNIITGLRFAAEIGGTYSLIALASGAVSGGILYWFITNRTLFLVGHTYQTREGADGEKVTELVPVPKSNISTGIIVAAIVVIFIAPILVIAFLSLLGPQIGEVFSRITTGLSAP